MSKGFALFEAWGAQEKADDVFDSVYNTIHLNWEYGSFSSSDGSLVDYDNRIRTEKMLLNKGDAIYLDDSKRNLYYNIATYKDGVFESTGWITEKRHLITEDCELIVALAYRDNSTIDNPSDINESLNVYRKSLNVYKKEFEGMLSNDLEFNFSYGTISSSTGKPSGSNSRLRTRLLKVKKGTILEFSNPNNLYWYNLAFYEEVFNFSPTGFIDDRNYIFEEDANVIIVIAYKDNSEITDPSEFESVLNLKEPKISDNQITQDQRRISIPSEFYWSDFTFVGDELWAFRQSDGSMSVSTDVGAIYIFNKDLVYKKRLLHDFGHVNTIDYNSNSDLLIFGNGGGEYGTDGKIHIILGVEHWREFEDDTMLNLSGGIEGSTIRTIDVAREFGDKVNVCWGEDNNGADNICYILSNDNANVARVLLGKGSSELTSGQFVSGLQAYEFNGTYQVLNEYSTTSEDVNQGTCYYNGYLWSAIGHDGLMMARFKLNSGGSITTELKHEKAYSNDGTPLNYASEGVAIKNNQIYHATFNQVNAIHIYPVY